MQAYDPDITPNAATWLALDEQTRMDLIHAYHRQAKIKVPNMLAHGVIHTVIENQIAMNIDAVVRAMQRLQQEGLSRHDAVHAIGSVLAEFLFSPPASAYPKEVTGGNNDYCAAVEQLSAKKWLEEHER